MAQLKDTTITGIVTAGDFHTTPNVIVKSSEFDESSYSDDTNVDDQNWLSQAEDIIKTSTDVTYNGQKFLLLKEPYSSGLEYKNELSSSKVHFSYFAVRNPSPTYYDTSGLILSQSISGDDLVLQYTNDGTNWYNYTTLMTGSAVDTTELISTGSTIEITDLSVPYRLRIAQVSSVARTYPQTYYSESWITDFGDWTNGAGTGEAESNDINSLLGFSRKSGPTTNTQTTTVSTSNTFISENYLGGAGTTSFSGHTTDGSSVLRTAQTSPYTGQNWLVLYNSAERYIAKTESFSGNVTVRCETLKSISGTYDSTGLALENADSGEDLVLEYSNDNVNWTLYTTVRYGGNATDTVNYKLETFTVTGISGTYYLRLRQASHSGISFDHYAIRQFTVFYSTTTTTTSTTNTGPAASMDDGIYIYANTDSPNDDNDWFGIQRSFSVQESLNIGLMSFSYHAFGSGIGTLYVKISTNGGASWTTLDINKNVDISPSVVSSISGQQQTSSTQSWQRAEVDLESYAGTEYIIRFLYQGTNLSTGHFAIDRVFFENSYKYPQYGLKDVSVDIYAPIMKFSGSISASAGFIGDGSRLENLNIQGVASLTSDNNFSGTNTFTGNVGIGTTNPTANLDVSGSFRTDIYIDSTTITDASYSVTNDDYGKTIIFNSADTQTITIPSGLRVGFNFSAIQAGAGQLTFTVSGGSSLVNRNSHTSTAGQYAVASIISINSTEYLLVGDTQ